MAIPVFYSFAPGDSFAISDPSCANVIQNCLVAVERPSSPIFTDLTEQPVFNRIPLGGSSWIMAHCYGDVVTVTKFLLKIDLPSPVPESIAPAAISQDQKAIRIG